MKHITIEFDSALSDDQNRNLIAAIGLEILLATGKRGVLIVVCSLGADGSQVKKKRPSGK